MKKAGRKGKLVFTCLSDFIVPLFSVNLGYCY